MKVKYGDLEIEPLLRLCEGRTDEWLLLEQSLALLEKVALKSQKTLVVFFDEFGELYDLGERVIKIFRSMIQPHKHVNYLFAGSQETLMTKIFVESSGAFYRFGELIFIDCLNPQEVLSLLTALKLPYEVIHCLVDQFRYHPYYTSKIIKDLLIDPHHAASLASFSDYLRQVLMHQENAYLELQLQKIKQRSHALDLMAILALGLDPYHYPTNNRQTVHAVLKNLEQSGFIVKIDKAQYRIADPLLALYLSQ